MYNRLQTAYCFRCCCKQAFFYFLPYCCIWFPAFIDSTPSCHRARGEFATRWTQTPRDHHTVKKKTKKLKGFNVSFRTERWSRMVSCQCSGRSLYLNAEEEPECREGEPQQACSVYRHTETDIFPICLRRPGLAVC